MPRAALSTSDIPDACQNCVVRHEGACAALGAVELHRLARLARHTHHAAGETLVHENSRTTSYANVTGGVVKLSRLLSDGQQQVVGLQFAPDLVGRLFSRHTPLSIEAASEVDLCRVPRATLERLVASNPDLKQRLLQQSLRELDEAREWMVTLGRKTAQQRVASLFLLVARRTGGAKQGDPDRLVFELPLTRSDMADFLGITIETVSRQISKLRHDGVVEIVNYRHVTVPDVARLAARAG